MFLKNVSFGSPFEISIEFRQKSLKNYDFVEKNFKQNFGDFAKKLHIKSDEFTHPPFRNLRIFQVSPLLARGTLRTPVYDPNNKKLF
jgi:hypothetical protein